MKRFFYMLLALCCVAGFAGTLYAIFYIAPLQGVGADWNVATPLYFNQKIFYYHVPNAFMVFIAVFGCGVASLQYLITRSGRWDDVAVANADLAVMYGAIVLVTGSIWGKVAWGKWWDWDVRMTSTLLLWLTMLGYALVRRYGGLGSERLGAGLAVFATCNVPLVYFGVRYWRTLHPKTSVVPGLQGDQRLAFWGSVILFLAFFVLLLRTRIDIVRAERRVLEAREAALDGGLF